MRARLPVRLHRRLHRRLHGRLSLVAAVALTTGLVAGALTAATEAGAAPLWAPAATARIHPGVQLYTAGAQCTANFVYTDTAGAVYVGYAAHCAGTGAATDTNGCTAQSLPLGTAVRIAEGGSLLSSGTTVGSGTLVYSSWRTMQARAESDQDICAYNDLGLVKVDAGSVGTVNPSIPFWGGPTGVSGTPAALGAQVYSYGNSSLRAGVSLLSPKTGLSLGAEGNGWSQSVYTVTPGVPGDSGSAFVDGQGRALGVLSTLQLTPLAGANGVGTVARELAYAQAHSGIAGLRLVNGTEPFSPVP